ncbi:MAG TPA: hypothetical protein VHW01_18620 [Polyangiaceae bacterium]|nr:hypothetical protein [Polyangiaceae bacterium]
MQKERAASALAHGLPVPTPPPTRTRSTEHSSSRPPSSAPPLARPSSAPPGRRMPLAVKLLAGGLGLLVVVYGLTLFRDHKDADAVRPSSAPESQAALVAPSIAPVPASHDTLARAPATIPSVPVAAAPASASASAVPMMPHLAARMKSLVAKIQSHKADGTAGTSAVQPNVAAALVPANAAPVGSAVK